MKNEILNKAAHTIRSHETGASLSFPVDGNLAYEFAKALLAANEDSEKLAAENVAMRADYLSTPALKRKGYPIGPATDAAIAEFKAQGVIELADDCDDQAAFVEPEDYEHYLLMAEQARQFAAKLRAGVKP